MQLFSVKEVPVLVDDTTYRGKGSKYTRVQGNNHIATTAFCCPNVQTYDDAHIFSKDIFANLHVFFDLDTRLIVWQHQSNHAL